MKKFLIVILACILTSCSFTDNNKESIEKGGQLPDKNSEDLSSSPVPSSEEKFSLNDSKNIKYSYPLDESSNFKKDKGLSVNRMLFTYPAEIMAKEGDPYSIDDLKNLDYSKDIFYQYLNFRIPTRAQVFSKDKNLYAIDFPKSKDYGIRIYFKKALDKNDFKSSKTDDLLFMTANNYMTKIENSTDQKIIQKPYEIFNSQMNAYYFISQDDLFNHTYLFVSSPYNIVVFDIEEVRDKSDVSKYIMADLLSTMYIETEDPINVKKNFDSFTKDIDLFATDKIDFDNFSLSLPKNMKNFQDDDDFKAFANEKNGDVLSYVLIIKSPKTDKNGKDLDLDQIFNQTSGSAFPPAYIVSMDQVKDQIIKDNKALSSEIRIYMDNSTSEGVKTVIQTKNDFITLILTGPLANSNQTKLLNKNILNTLTFK
ncbi:MAG: hypothetical protein PUG67_00650 [Peptoniphilaceae bacterium]|nr:hypothetical protein [Peptoniphilaceae bacterium]MDY6018797.1 hypothetical protein [Anaerococcus sp.]